MTEHSDIKPKWITHGARDQAAMLKWSIERLWEEFPDIAPNEVEVDANIARHELERAYVALKKAETIGNIDDMVTRLSKNQKLLRHFVEEQLAKHKKGRPRMDNKRLNEEWQATIARGFLARLRTIWRDHYGKTNRRRDNGPSAEEVVEQFFQQELNVHLKDGWEKKH